MTFRAREALKNERPPSVRVRPFCLHLPVGATPPPLIQFSKAGLACQRRHTTIFAGNRSKRVGHAAVAWGKVGWAIGVFVWGLPLSDRLFVFVLLLIVTESGVHVGLPVNGKRGMI